MEWRQSTLEQWDQAFERQLVRLSEITADLTSAQLSARPAPEKWSVAHCLDHLGRTLVLYRPNLEGAIERGLARVGGHGERELFPAYRPGRFARWFIALAGPNKKPLPAPKKFRPADQPAPDTVDNFKSELEAVRALLRRADGVNLNATKFRSPATALLRFRIGEGFDLLLQHNDRHLGQAERAAAATETSFPEA